MDTVNVQDLSVNDLAWVIDYHADLCVLCGACVASCSFQAISFVSTQKLLPKQTAKSRNKGNQKIVVKQSADPTKLCCGCGICEKVCPSRAIRPIANTHSREHCLNQSQGPKRRGGRGNLAKKRTLDAIFVGRISQMTDPPLDAERHTFDLRAPLGRVLAADKLPLEVSGQSLRLKASHPPVAWIYPLIFSDMSIGALSTRAWEAIAIATAYLNEECGLPVRMCSGEGGVPQNLLTSDKLAYMILQIASGHFGWNRILRALPKMRTDPAGVLIKIGQGAKPGDGGWLAASKVSRHIQAIRGVPQTTLHSPPNHQGLYSIEESVQKMHLSLNQAFGFRVPVAIKCAASSTSVAVYNNLLRDPYQICGGFFLDGLDGGTGAANTVALNHTGHPITSKLRDCYKAATAQGLQGQIPLWVGGGIGMHGDAAADAFKLICLGANGVFVGRMLLELLGCVGNAYGRCNQCHTGKCPTGLCTQDLRLVQRLDVDRGAENIVNFVLNFDQELRKLLAPVGNSSLPVGRSDALISNDWAIAQSLDIAFAC
ncbi:MAG: 4Fe-4S dicluster domain-containing protein [Desulfovibrio sp.]|nr:4Fe-4S dicluster domain-containing protein [Desulfovibrio sp.]